MKKIIYLTGALVICANILFSTSLLESDSNIFDLANADMQPEPCGIITESYINYRPVFISVCESEEGICGISTVCEEYFENKCDAFMCDVVIG